MGEIVRFNRGQQNNSTPFPSESAAPVDPHRRALQALAEKLRGHRFKGNKQGGEREAVARNWRAIVVELKRERGLTKGKIYAVLQRSDTEGTELEAQKKSQQYEIPDDLSGRALNDRISKITQSGERWLRLAEQAASLIGEDRHYWLPGLLKGTTIAPASSLPGPDTPDPVAAVLTLATIACQKIAAALELESFFSNWDRMWVAYRPFHNDFVPFDLGWGDQDESNVGAVPADVCTRFYLLDETEESQPSWGQHPFPSAAFAEMTRLGPMEARACHVAGEYEKLRDLRVSFVRVYRLAIGLNAVDRQIAPVIEMRHEVRLTDSGTGKDVPFWPGEVFYDAHQFLTDTRDFDEDDRGDGVEGNGPVDGFLGRGYMWTPDGWRCCDLHCAIPRAELDDMAMKLDERDEDLDVQGYSLDCYYRLLTPYTVQELLSHPHMNSPRRPGRIRTVSGTILSESGDCDPSAMLTLTPYSAMGLKLLEEALLEGAAEGSFYRQLFDDAKAKVDSFNRAYQDPLARVIARHERARSALEGEQP